MFFAGAFALGCAVVVLGVSYARARASADRWVAGRGGTYVGATSGVVSGPAAA